MITLAGLPAYAVEGPHQAFWLNLDYTYTDVDYQQPSVMGEKGRLAGVRGQFGLNLFGLLALSAGGEYQDGHLTYDGSTLGGGTLKQVTQDYVRQTEYLAHVFYGSVTVSAGVAEREWYNDLVTSYRRRTRYHYLPMYLSYRMGPIYLKFEHDIWQKGWNKSYMNDVNASAHDVEFSLGTGTGSGAELGYLIMSGQMATRVFVAYHKWEVKDSNTQNDGTQNLFEPKSTTVEIKAGIGLAF